MSHQTAAGIRPGLISSFVVAIAILGVAFGVALTRFYSLHEDFLSVNFDSVHGARTLIRAQVFLGMAHKDLESVGGGGPISHLDEAMRSLSLAASYGAEGEDRTPDVRSRLVVRARDVLDRTAGLRHRMASAEGEPRREAIGLARAVRELADDFGAAELERWAALSTINGEMARRMTLLGWSMAGAGLMFVFALAALIWSIGRQRQVEKELRFAKQLAETIQQTTLDAAPNGIVYVGYRSPERREILRVNKKIEEMFGYSASEMIGQDAAMVYPDAAAFRHVGQTAYPAMMRGETFRAESCFRHKDGHTFWCAMSGRAIDVNAPELGFVALIENIEQRKRAELEIISARQAAEEANAAKSRFLAAASHDLRQPMQAIGLFLHALERSEVDDQQARLLALLSASAKVLGELLDALLDISKLDAGMVVPKIAPVDIHSLFASIEAECAQLALVKGLRFMIFMPRHAFAVHTDVKLLRVILRNIIGNAIKYTERGGVLVGVRRQRGELLIEVWDTGIGIAEHHLEQIYREYFQVANPQRDRSKGLGLGLAIVKRLVALLGYGIECRSVPGRGTVFAIRIPGSALMPSGESCIDAAVDERPGSLDRLQGCRIVVIEDDPLAAKGLEVVLGTYGLVVASFGSADEALADRDIASADFYVSDFRLPGRMNGLDLLQAIQSRAGRLIDGLIITGDTSSEQIGILAASGWPVLHKPVDPVKLLAAISQAVVGNETATAQTAS